MSQPFSAVKISEHVYWVGAVDWGIRDFHGYLTARGTTYNAYLILADKVTLIDTVKSRFTHEMLSRIGSVLPPENIAYIVSNHAEVDHSGALPQAIAQLQPERVFASARGVEALEQHFHLGREIVGVKEGDTVSLGNLALRFIETPMLHWPESMFTYLAQDQVLFSSDAFGSHFASAERFADEVDAAALEREQAKYFANILLPFSALVARLLDKMDKLGLPLQSIAPSHGPIWRRDLNLILERYAKWAQQKRGNRAVVVYDTMWESTALMAQAIAEGLLAGGAAARLMPLKSAHRSDVATEMLDAGALIVGSPTLNNGILPLVADCLTYLKGLKPRGLVGAAFGSYGWSGESVEQVKAMLSEMKVDLVGDGVKVKYVPDAAALQECQALGLAVAERLQGREAAQ